ncbi:hypothetical protein KJ780_02165 [Candidatus Micrarchaeota archaeon]|nr:hypothetical protein [Candidatus Micrarchaeota archaeon]
MSEQQIYSMEITFRDKPVILTLSINDKDNSTTILLTDKSGNIVEEFYNKPKK